MTSVYFATCIFTQLVMRNKSSYLFFLILLSCLSLTNWSGLNSVEIHCDEVFEYFDSTVAVYPNSGEARRNLNIWYVVFLLPNWILLHLSLSKIAKRWSRWTLKGTLTFCQDKMAKSSYTVDACEFTLCHIVTWPSFGHVVLWQGLVNF
jgi:hypothetical protein